MSKKATPLTSHQKTARGILALLSVLALIAGASSLGAVIDAPTSTRAVETWRMVGFFTFAALFSLLAQKMQNNKELWSIIIANKLALTVIGIFFVAQGGIAGASDFVAFDGTISILLIIASFLAGVWKKK
jgi:peptidoglycan/LPS O-acetylase OafA/YrhL